MTLLLSEHRIPGPQKPAAYRNRDTCVCPFRIVNTSAGAHLAGCLLIFIHTYKYSVKIVLTTFDFAVAASYAALAAVATNCWSFARGHRKLGQQHRLQLWRHRNACLCTACVYLRQPRRSSAQWRGCGVAKSEEEGGKGSSVVCGSSPVGFLFPATTSPAMAPLHKDGNEVGAQKRKDCPSISLGWRLLRLHFRRISCRAATTAAVLS